MGQAYVGGEVIVDGKLGKIREMADGKARCEWIDGASLRSEWYPVDLLNIPLTEAEQEEQRRKVMDYNPFGGSGGSFSGL